MEHYAATRKCAILPFVTTWTDLEDNTLSKISHSETAKDIGDFTHMWDIKLKVTSEQARKINKNS